MVLEVGSGANSSQTKADLFLPVIVDRVYLAEESACQDLGSEYHCFSTANRFIYIGYCDDFGPMNLSSVMRFCRLLNDEMTSFENKKIVYSTDGDSRKITNAAFLLGAYLILVHNSSPEEVWDRFADAYQFVAYRDATFAPPSFGLTLQDCWRGLASGKALGWIGSRLEEGYYDLAEYEHYDDPANGELHIVVPDKFVAFRGPKSLFGSAEYEDSADGIRCFAPRYYHDIFREIGVTTVIRLNNPEYDPAEFTRHGIAHVDLEFEDCTAPDNATVARFLRVVDKATTGNMIAVHCKAGLGRTGTLIALYLILAHRFTARAAIAWLRIVRPGSVLGDQQQYLCDVEQRLAAAGPTAQPPNAAGARAQTGSEGPVDEWPEDECRPQRSSCVGSPTELQDAAAAAAAARGRCVSESAVIGRRDGGEGGGCGGGSSSGGGGGEVAAAALSRQVLEGLERRTTCRIAAAAAAAAAGESR